MSTSFEIARAKLTDRLAWEEYDDAAKWCAKRGYSGDVGSPLPPMLSWRTFQLIQADPEAFAERVKATAYALAMEQHEEHQL